MQVVILREVSIGTRKNTEEHCYRKIPLFSKLPKIYRDTKLYQLPDPYMPKKSIDFTMTAGAGNFKPSGKTFFNNFYEAYATHGSVCISPDDIFQHIMLQVSSYLNRFQSGKKKIEKYRHLIVSHEGKKELCVEVGCNNPDDLYPEMLCLFHDAIFDDIKEEAEWMLGHFSTTSFFDNIFNSAIIMDAFKELYDYKCSVSCGIRNLYMEGTLEDWYELRNKIDKLRIFNLGEWVNHLLPVIDKFIEVFENKVDEKFWAQIFRDDAIPNAGGMGYYEIPPKEYVTGWFKKFYYYGYKHDKVHIAESFDNIMTMTPVKIIYNDNEIEKNVVASHSHVEIISMEEDRVTRIGKTITVESVDLKKRRMQEINEKLRSGEITMEEALENFTS